MKIKAILIVVAAIFIMGLTPTVSADEVNFSQIDFYLDGVPTLNSDWGSVNFTFTGQESIMYFNLVANGSWQVQNMPVLSIEGEGVNQSISFAFDLGVPSGTTVTSLNYGYTFTNTTIGSMPAETETAVVFDQEVIISSGAEGVVIPPVQPAKPLIGGAAVSAKMFEHDNFPNQDCGWNQCCPAAVSNSLKFLNKKHKMGLNDNNLSIDKMKNATKWKVPPRKIGCYIDHNDHRPEGARNAWWEDKKAYMEKNKIPVTTRKITDLSKLIAEGAKGQDIEIVGDWHTAAVVGMTDLGGGKYEIVVAHDTKQNETGGTKKDKITYDPATKKFTGSPGFFHNSSFRYAIVECPHAINLTNLGPEYQEVLPGETANYTIRVTNLGSETDTIPLKHENISESGSCSWTVDLSKYTVTLDPNAHEDVTLSVTSALSCEISSRKKTKVTGTSQNGLDCGVTIADSVIKETHVVPEFTTIAIPVVAILGLLFLFSRRRRKT